jgi:enoyl-CoA hydratase/carnithine racemase
MDLQTVLYEVRDRAAWITINRPEQRNAINLQVQLDLIASFDEAKRDPEVKVAVLTGSGDKAFCAGGDLGGMPAGASSVELHYGRGAFTDLFRRMARLGKPILGAVNGHALAGGMGLAMACDLVVASSNATFGLTEVNIGLWPMMITPVIVRALGRRKALELMLTGDRYPADEMLRAGAINQVATPDDFPKAVETMAAKLASKSPAIVRLGRDAFYACADMSFDQALDFLQAQFSVLLQCEDVVEGVTAFFQKREPEWKGR